MKVTGSAEAAGSAIVTDGGVPSGVGIVTGSNEAVSYQSTSTHPSIPGTAPQLPYCQKVQPLPFQFPAGTVGAETPQCATHSTVYPAAATAVVLPVRVCQPFGLV